MARPSGRSRAWWAYLAGEVAALADARKRLLDRTVQAREKERIRLAAELHDGPIQRLTGAAYAADLSRRRPAASDGRAAPSGPGRVGTVGGPRRLRQELPGADRDRLQRPHQPPGPAGQSPGDGAVPGRQEALTNVVKHARAHQARVLLQVGHGRVTLQVTDDGTGFVAAQAADPIAGHLGLNHFGLASMRQQLEMAGGSWQVHSRPGYGTTVTATLPLAALS